MKIKNISLALLAMSAIASCSEDEIKLFEATPSINLGIVDQYKPITSSDTLVNIAFGFLNTKIVDSTRLVRCKLQGTPVKYDRVVKFKFSGTAVSSDFEAVNEFVIKSGAIDIDVPVKLNRANLEKDGAKRLTIEIIPTNEILEGVHTRVHFDIADEVPTKWVNELYGMMATNNLGACTKTKYRFFYDMMGFFDFAPVGMGDYGVIKNIMKGKLSDYNSNPAKYDFRYGPVPMLDDDGVSEVQF